MQVLLILAVLAIYLALRLLGFKPTIGSCAGMGIALFIVYHIIV